ncbi:amidase family protein [Streptomyces sp. NPDC051992]|uniref:amidase family protein n=1 Tax=Streptomyces sp. NPDC051992 TaxID=3161012 RepID=UPI00343B5BD6
MVDARLGRDLPKIDAGEDPVAVEETARGGQQVGLRLLELFERYDLLLLPTVPTTAWPAEGPDTLRSIREGTLPIAFTSIFNDTGHPAITVPAGLAPDGLPCSVQLVAPHHREDRLLAAARLVEESEGTLRPPVSMLGER